MSKSSKFCPFFDAIGLGSLVISIFALGGAIWFVESATQGTLINVFQISFASSITSFLIARTLQILDVIKSTPDPKSLRVVAVNEAASPDLDSSNVVAGEIRRAA